MMRKYYTDWKTIVVVFVVGAILFGGSIALEPRGEKWVQAETALTLSTALLILLCTRFSYAEISGTALRFVYLLFYRRTIDIRDITEINDQPTYKAAKSSFRSLYIFYNDKNGVLKWIELRITVFPEKTLGKLIKDLKEINPHIELNKYAEKLMTKASKITPTTS